MEIIGSSKEKGTVYIAVLTLAVVGFALVFSTWQILRRQKEASLEHLELTSLAVLQAVDSSLRRGPMMGGSRFSGDTRDFFRDLENSGDILFVGIIDENGVRQVAGNEGKALPLAFPLGALRQLQSGNRWQGQAKYGDKPIYVAARPVRTIADAMHNRGHRRRDEFTPIPQQAPDPRFFLMVAVDMEKHFAVFQGFKRTAIFQTAYILAAAIFLWILAVRFMSRRKLAGKAAFLERFQARLIDSLPDALLIADKSGVIRAANPAAQAMFAEHASPLAGKSMARLSLPDTAPGSDGWVQAAVGGMQLEMRSVPYREEDGDDASLVIIRDRTKLRTLEKNLAEAEQLAAIGGLAAGVAHEIRNPLSALRGFAQYFAKKLAGKQPEEEYAQTMVRESDRLNRVVTDLLYLARPRDLAPVSLALNETANETEALLQFELREHGLTLQYELTVEEVTADPDALKQALLNLLLNSIEAMADEAACGDKILAVATERGTVEGRPGVWISVIDTGPGMNAEEREQAFKPFFTTKKKGTGLGLALVHTIMRGHGGSAVIDCPPQGRNMGCAVRLFFPDTTILEPGRRYSA